MLEESDILERLAGCKEWSRLISFLSLFCSLTQPFKKSFHPRDLHIFSRAQEHPLSIGFDIGPWRPGTSRAVTGFAGERREDMAGSVQTFTSLG